MRAVLTFHSIDERPGPLSYSPRGFSARTSQVVICLAGGSVLSTGSEAGFDASKSWTRISSSIRMSERSKATEAASWNRRRPKSSLSSANPNPRTVFLRRSACGLSSRVAVEMMLSLCGDLSAKAWREGARGGSA